MAQPNKYKHYLRYWDGAQWVYYIVTAGAVSTTTTKTALSRAPEGWQEYEVSWERGWTYYGIFTNYSTPLKFVKDGAKIVRHLLYTYGIEGNDVNLLIEKQDVSDWTFDTFFEANLDMSKAQDEFDYMIVPVIQAGFLEKLRARENNTYVYDLDDNASVRWLRHDGIDMQALIKWNCLPGETSNGYYQPTLVHVDTEGTNYYLRPTTQYKQPTSLTEASIVSNVSGQDVDVDFRFIYKVRVDLYGGAVGACHFKIRFRTVDAVSGAVISEYDIITNTAVIVAGSFQTYSGDETFTFTVEDGTYVEVVYRMYDTGTMTNLISGIDYDTTTYLFNLNGYFINRYEVTYIPTLPIRWVVQSLIEDLSEDATINVSDTLTDVYLNDQVVLTSGDGIRFLEGCKLSVNFIDVFKFLDAKFSASMHYSATTNTVYIGRKEDVFEDALNPDIDTFVASDFKAIPFNELSFSTLKIGSGLHSYDKKNSTLDEITNGKDEFNTTVERISPLDSMNGKESDYDTKIRCDMYGIELVRANLSKKELADASGDNEVFAFHITAATVASTDIVIQGVLTTISYYELFRTPINLTPGASYFEIENMFNAESVYNILFSPLRSLLNNGTWFRSILKFNDSGALRFMASGKNNPNNTKMIVYEGVVPTEYNEGANVTISTLCAAGDVIFQPILYKIKTKEDIDISTIINTYLFRYINFTFNGISLNGYIIRVTAKPTWREGVEFDLLAHRDDDLTDLIR